MAQAQVLFVRTWKTLRKLCSAGTWSILGCPLLCVMESGRIWNHVFWRRPLFSYLLLLLEPSFPSWSVSISSRNVITGHLRLSHPCSSFVHHTLGIGKRLVFSPSWEPMPSLLSRQWSSNALPWTYSGAESLTSWQPPGIPGQDCRDIVLKLGWTYLMRSLSY